MKKSALFSLAAVLMTACNQGLVDDVIPSVEGNATLTINATTDELSRVTTEDGLRFTMAANTEQIGVYLYSSALSWTEENILFVAGEADANGWLSFSAAENRLLNIKTGVKVLAYAPYVATDVNVVGNVGENPTPETSSIGTRTATVNRYFTIPALQTQATGGSATGLANYYALAAQPADPVKDDDNNYSVDLQFSGIFALVRVVVKNETDAALTVNKVVLSCESGAIVGTFAADLMADPSFANTAYSLTAVENKTSDSVSVELDTPTTLAVNGETSFYAVVNSTSATPTIKVYATDADNNAVAFAKTYTEKTFARDTRTSFGLKMNANTMVKPYAKVDDTHYQINTAEGFTWLVEQVNTESNDFNGVTITLNDNITLTEESWTPIAQGTRSGNNSTGNAFKGTFDGNNKTISGLTISTGGKDDAIGLFGIIDGGTVKNLTLDDVSINAPSNENAGAVAGLVTNGGTIENIKVYGTVTAKRGNGGIAGRVLVEGTIKDCENHATISGTSTNVGGIVGAAYYTAEGKTMTIEGCTNYGTVTSAGYTGGIAGLSAANIKNCTNKGAVTASSSSSVGGIVGEQQNAGSISGCTNTANVTNTAAGSTGPNNTSYYGTGGIVGWVRYFGATTDYPVKNIVEIYSNTNSGNISGPVGVGGIVGVAYSYSHIYRNTNTASSITAYRLFVAGVVGTVQNDSHPGIGTDDDWHVYITNNYSTTKASQMTGSCAALYVYINSPEHTTASGNYGAEEVVPVTEEGVAASITAGNDIIVGNALETIDLSTVTAGGDVNITLTAAVGGLVLANETDNTITIAVAKDVDYPTLSVKGGSKIKNLTIIGDPTSSKAITSGICAQAGVAGGSGSGIATIENVTFSGVRFSGKGINFGYTKNPQTTKNITIQNCVATDLVECFFQTNNNKYDYTDVGNISIVGNTITYADNAADNTNGLYICNATSGTVLVEGNTITNCKYHGVMMYENNCSEVIVRNNNIVNAQKDGIKMDYPTHSVTITGNSTKSKGHGIRIARFGSNYNPTVTITGNNIDMSASSASKNGIVLAESNNENNEYATAILTIKNNVKGAGTVNKWFEINSHLTPNEGSDIATPFVE